jgi:hypothetical protein
MLCCWSGTTPPTAGSRSSTGGRRCSWPLSAWVPALRRHAVSQEAVHLAHMHHGAANWPDDVGSHLIQEGRSENVSRTVAVGQ